MLGRFNQNSPDASVSRFRDRLPFLPLAARIFSGNQSEKSHERARVFESTELEELHHQDHRAVRVDSSQHPKPPDGFPVQRRVCDLLDLAVEVRETFVALRDGQLIMVERPTVNRFELEPIEKPLMRLRPIFPGKEKPSPVDELRQTMPSRDSLNPHGVPSSNQIPNRLLLFRRRLDARQITAPKRFRQLPGISFVRLHPLAGFAWNQRRRDHFAGNPEALEGSLQSETRRTRLVARVNHVRRHLFQRLRELAHSRRSAPISHSTKSDLRGRISHTAIDLL